MITENLIQIRRIKFRKFKKIALIFLFSFFFVFLGIRVVSAQNGVIPDNAADKSICSWSDPESIEIVSEGNCREKVWVGSCSTFINTGQDAITGWRWRDFSCTYKNGDTAEVQKIIGSRNEGLLGMIHNASLSVINQKPVSGIQFFEDKVYALQNVGKVEAQSAPAFYYPGTGFDLLRPIQGLWGWSVNVVYGLLILVIVGVALAIIFRANIDGGTAVTIQNAIPNIAMAMILVPLSYAISGLFIDAVTLGTNAVHQFFLAPGSPANVVYEQRSQLGTGLSGYGIIEDGTLNDRGLFPDDDRVNIFNAKNGVSVDDSLNNYLNTDPSFGSINQAGLILGIVQIFDPSATGWMGEIVNLVIAVILMLTSLRIFWLLLGKYATILFFPIFSPFIFATVAIPGNGTKAIITYVKTLGSFSLYYIVAYAMILLSVILANESFQSQIPDIQTTGYIPPLLGINNQIQSFTDENSFLGITGLMLGLGAIVVYLNIPSALKGIDKALGTEFAIPSFVTNAWQSAKDSVDLARRGIAAPGQAYGVAKTAAAIPGQAKSGVGRGYQRLLNVRDRVAGIRPGERGSALYNRRAQIASEIGQKERERRAALERGDYGAARAAERSINSLKASMSNISAAGPEDQKEFKAGSIKVEISFNGAPYPIKWDEGIMKTLNAHGPNPISLGKGKLAIKSENFQLNPRLFRQLRLKPVQKSDRTKFRSDPTTGAAIPLVNTNQPNSVRNSYTNLDAALVEASQTLSNAFNYFQFIPNNDQPQPRNYIRPIFKFDEVDPDGSGGVYEASFNIEIDNAQQAYNDITPTSPFLTSKYVLELAITYGSKESFIESNPFDLMIITDYHP